MSDDRRRCRAGSPRCNFHGTRDELREHAAEVGHDRCIICALARAVTERQTCIQCEAAVRDDLDGVARAFAHLERVIGQAAYRGIAWTQLAMSGDGSTTGGGEDDHPKWHDPLPPAAVLDAEERAWREEFGHGRPPYPALGHPDRQARQVVSDAIGYLRDKHHLAATTYSAFDDYAATIRELRGKLEHAVGLADDPEPAAPCFLCGGDLIRRYTETGLSDDRVCRKCAAVYEPKDYWFALRVHTTQEGWVPIEEAAERVDRPVATIRTWVYSGHVAVACNWYTQRTVVELAAVEERSEQVGRVLKRRSA